MKIFIEMDLEEGDDVEEMHDEFRRQMEYITTSVIEENVGTMKLYDLRTEKQIGTSRMEED